MKWAQLVVLSRRRTLFDQAEGGGGQAGPEVVGVTGQHRGLQGGAGHVLPHELSVARIHLSPGHHGALTGCGLQPILCSDMQDDFFNQKRIGGPAKCCFDSDMVRDLLEQRHEKDYDLVVCCADLSRGPRDGPLNQAAIHSPRNQHWGKQCPMSCNLRTVKICSVVS